MKRYSVLTIFAIGMIATIVTTSDGRAAGQDTAACVANPILSRPTDKSITVRVVPKRALHIYFEYGTASSIYTKQSETTLLTANTPLQTVLSSLVPNTRYYYRMRYKEAGSTLFLSGEEHTFYTQRSKGIAFSFTIEADPHPYDKKGSHSLWYIAMRNQLKDSADFMLDLGDTFGDDHNPTTITSEELRQLHLDCLPFFGTVAHSSPLFLCIGNHEGESGYYLLQTPPNNLGVNGTLWRKYYYANPVPDEFYTGNFAVEGYGIGAPENYFAWVWGDALFVVLDAYRGYTANAKPRNWDWTLGKDQYDWFKKTLETSMAKYKFVFTHHTLGETRGGVATAKFHEWGGYEADGKTWGFTTSRPGWEMPIHQLMVKNGVSVFFQGHDHLFVKEELDGLVYQEVPMPDDSTYIIGTRDNGDAYTGVIMDASGHLRVGVSSTVATVDYVRAWLPADESAQHKNGEVAYSYSVLPKVTAVDYSTSLPTMFSLEQNFPNPFNPSTTIRYSIPARGFVDIAIYDVLGRNIAQLVHGEQAQGMHEVRLNAAGLPSGLYVYQLKCNGSTITKKALLLR